LKITIKIGILFALIWMLVKYLYHFIYPNSTEIKFTILINMLLLISSIALGLYLHKKLEGFKQGNMLSDIKNALTSGVFYTLFVSLFIYVYYAFINPQFNEHQINEIKTSIKKEIDSEKGLKDIRKSQAAFEVKTKNQIYLELIKGPEMFYSAKSTFILSLLSLLLLSTLYSILITVIYRKILLKGLI
jgi:hypothetical protein